MNAATRTHAGLILATLGAVSVSVLQGCMPYHQDVHPNGEAGMLLFGGVDSWLDTGVTAPVTVSRIDTEWTLCTLRSCEVDYDSTSVELEAASCDAAACDVVASTAPRLEGVLALLVTGRVAGPTTLRVRVTEHDGGASWEDSIPLTFVAPDPAR